MNLIKLSYTQKKNQPLHEAIMALNHNLASSFNTANEDCVSKNEGSTVLTNYNVQLVKLCSLVLPIHTFEYCNPVPLVAVEVYVSFHVYFIHQ